MKMIIIYNKKNYNKKNCNKKNYNKKNYLNENGSLVGSCMAAMKKKTFDIYTQNDDKVRLLILVDKLIDSNII